MKSKKSDTLEVIEKEIKGDIINIIHAAYILVLNIL